MSSYCFHPHYNPSQGNGVSLMYQDINLLYLQHLSLPWSDRSAEKNRLDEWGLHERRHGRNGICLQGKTRPWPPSPWAHSGQGINEVKSHATLYKQLRRWGVWGLPVLTFTYSTESVFAYMWHIFWPSKVWESLGQRFRGLAWTLNCMWHWFSGCLYTSFSRSVKYSFGTKTNKQLWLK